MSSRFLPENDLSTPALEPISSMLDSGHGDLSGSRHKTLLSPSTAALGSSQSIGQSVKMANHSHQSAMGLATFNADLAYIQLRRMINNPGQSHAEQAAVPCGQRGTAQAADGGSRVAVPGWLPPTDPWRLPTQREAPRANPLPSVPTLPACAPGANLGTPGTAPSALVSRLHQALVSLKAQEASRKQHKAALHPDTLRSMAAQFAKQGMTAATVESEGPSAEARGAALGNILSCPRPDAATWQAQPRPQPPVNSAKGLWGPLSLDIPVVASTAGPPPARLSRWIPGCQNADAQRPWTLAPTAPLAPAPAKPAERRAPQKRGSRNKSKVGAAEKAARGKQQGGVQCGVKNSNIQLSSAAAAVQRSALAVQDACRRRFSEQVLQRQLHDGILDLNCPRLPHLDSSAADLEDRMSGCGHAGSVLSRGTATDTEVSQGNPGTGSADRTRPRQVPEMLKLHREWGQNRREECGKGSYQGSTTGPDVLPHEGEDEHCSAPSVPCRLVGEVSFEGGSAWGCGKRKGAPVGGLLEPEPVKMKPMLRTLQLFL